MAIKKMGFHGEIYQGTKGSTATNRITNRRDVTETFDIGEGDTTEAGDGTNPPIETSSVTSRKYGIEWNMLNKPSDTNLTALMAAAMLGTPVAIRTKSYSSGLGFDGDMIIKVKRGMPLKGEQTLDFSGSPNDDDRAPLLNV